MSKELVERINKVPNRPMTKLEGELARKLCDWQDKHADLQADNEKLRNKWDRLDATNTRMAIELQEKIAKLQAENKRLKEQLIEVCKDIVARDCACSDGLDSMAISGNADAMRFLAGQGIVIIEKEYGRRVIGKWADRSLKGG